MLEGITVASVTVLRCRLRVDSLSPALSHWAGRKGNPDVTGQTGDVHPHHSLSLTFPGMVSRVREKGVWGKA